MKSLAVLSVVLVSLFFVSCGNKISGPEAAKYPAGWPQSVAEIARLYDSLPAFLEAVPPDSSRGDGLVQVELGKPNQYGHASSVVFSACTASTWYHCAKLETVYSETTSTIYGIKAYVGGVFFAGDSGTYGGYITLIHGKYNTNGGAQEKKCFFERYLIDSVRPDSIKVLLANPRPRYIIKNANYSRSPGGRYIYQMYDRTLDRLVDYGEY